ncbi:A1 cistron-splicing factor [Paraphysoderma sedebokerense]|nr:A1 cistron-splicing factor [Paraphysoderma sedebokerense]
MLVNSMTMDPETALSLFHENAILLILKVPENIEFSIDLNSWTTGPKFKGIKFIPKGLHYFGYNSIGKHGPSHGIKTGYFKFFDKAEILVKDWDPDNEDLKEDSEMDKDQVERIKLHIREFDSNLGPYPLQPPSQYQKWQNLTSYITPFIIEKVLPFDGKLTSMSESTLTETGLRTMNNRDDARFHSAKNEMEQTKVQKMKEIKQQEEIQFTRIDLKRSFRKGAVGEEVTKYSQDKSWLLKFLLENEYISEDPSVDYRNLLGELQLSFVCLLAAQNFEGFEQWKVIIQLLCSCKEALLQHPDLFVEFFDVLETQLSECPTDFFHDVISANNFLTVMLEVSFASFHLLQSHNCASLNCI